jgi:hypothetical protein
VCPQRVAEALCIDHHLCVRVDRPNVRGNAGDVGRQALDGAHQQVVRVIAFQGDAGGLAFADDDAVSQDVTSEISPYP